MLCDLLVKGKAVFETGIFDVNYGLSGSWDSFQSYPTLTAVFTGTLSGRTYTQYKGDAPWQQDAVRWHAYPTFYLAFCRGIDTNTPFDCINGNCLPKTTYNTPGVFANLAACQNGCAKNSNCAGECIPTAEIAALQQAANIVRSRICR